MWAIRFHFIFVMMFLTALILSTAAGAEEDYSVGSCKRETDNQNPGNEQNGECRKPVVRGRDVAIKIREAGYNPFISVDFSPKIYRPLFTGENISKIQTLRPSSKIRNFVSGSEPEILRGSNYYDPSYLWTGLGRRR